jgi:transcriptional regulator with XRE-family HTH domain
MYDDLRSARERAGLSLEAVSERTRIPVKWLDALERGDVGAFPAGPFLAGYTRQYRAFLGLPATPAVAPTPAAPRPLAPHSVEPAPRPAARPPIEADDPVSEVQRPEHTVTLTSPRARVRRAGRMAAIGGASAALVLAGLYAFGRGGERVEEGVDIPPDQVLLVTTATPTHAVVKADGREIFSGPIAPGKQLKFAAHDELAIELEALNEVTLVYNGRTLKPLGAQSRARRLVFVDDHGG